MATKRHLVTMSIMAAAMIGMNADAAMAHGVGSRSDLPLPVWQVAWGAAVALVVSFAALGLLWVTPRLRSASVGRPIGATVSRIIDWLEWPIRILVLVVWFVVTTAALVGTDNPGVNVAPVALFVIFWVGVPILSALVGGIWVRLNPFDTIVALVTGGGREIEDPLPVGAVGPVALISISAFLWLELAYHTPASPRAIAVFLVGYAAAMITGGLRYGRRWLRANDGFVVLTSLIGAMAPVYRDVDGRVRLRAPFSGLSTIVPSPWTAGFILVVLGSTTFDGMEGLSFWREAIGGRQGWNFTVVSTAGLLWVVAVVAAAYHLASWATARFTGRQQPEVADDFSAALIPIMLAYAIAHYFSLLVFEGQNFLIQASDPYGEGWNLFGTGTNSVDFLLFSTAFVAWVQVASIVGGHIAGVVVAHDRAVEQHSQADAIRSQYPMLVAMIGYTVTGLFLLLSA